MSNIGAIVLALDGGGIRGLSSLLFLRDLMDRLGVRRDTAPPRPCDCFDMIIGTGTGGISALLLGRLGMTVQEAIEVFLRMGEITFKPTSTRVCCFGSQNARFNGDVLECFIGDIVQQKLGNRDALLADLSDGSTSCRTAVLAARSANVDAPPHVFQSYSSNRSASLVTICKVARATIATTGLFPPFSLGKPPIRFVDAGDAGYNNPAEVALDEAVEIPPGLKIDCLVSLGAGLQKIVSVSDKWSEVLAASMRIVEGCEQGHERVFRRLYPQGLPYFRFNVPRGLECRDVREWRIDELTAITEGHTRKAEVEVSLHACARALNREVSGAGVRQYAPLQNPAPKIFCGRDEYIDYAISIFLQDQPPLFPVLGPAGIGKTSIALKILHDDRIKEKFGPHRRFISCEGITSNISLAENFCTSLGISSLSSDNLLAHLSRTCHSQPLFVVLDHLETLLYADGGRLEVKQFIEALSTVPKMALLVTMRASESLDQTAGPPVVKPLGAEAARNTFFQNGGKEDEQLYELLQALNHVPLAVMLMAHLEQSDRPTELLRMWREHTSQDAPSPLDIVEASIRFSLLNSRMTSTPGALSLLSMISLLPVGVFHDELDSLYPGIPFRAAASATLRAVGLAFYDDAQTLRVLEPIRSYVKRHHPPSRDLLRDMESYYCELARLGRRELDENRSGKAFHKLARAGPNIETVLSKALSRGTGSVFLAAANWTFFVHQSNPQMSLIRKATHLARRDREHCHFSECLFSLGNTQRMLKDYLSATETLKEARVEFEMEGNTHRVADCQWVMGEIQRMQDDQAGARAMYKESAEKAKAVDYTRRMATCFQSIGNLERALDNLGSAREMLVKAHAAFEGIYQKRGMAECNLSLGSVLRLLKDYDGAGVTLELARMGFQALEDSKGVAECMRELGMVRNDLEDFDGASSMLKHAGLEFASLGGGPEGAECLTPLGTLQDDLRVYMDAQPMLHQTPSHIFDLADLSEDTKSEPSASDSDSAPQAVGFPSSIPPPATTAPGPAPVSTPSSSSQPKFATSPAVTLGAEVAGPPPSLSRKLSLTDLMQPRRKAGRKTSQNIQKFARSLSFATRRQSSGSSAVNKESSSLTSREDSSAAREEGSVGGDSTEASIASEGRGG